MERILIASGAEKSAAMLTALLKEIYPAGSIVSAKTSGEAKRIFSGMDFDCIIINAPMSDEFGCDLAEIVVTQSMAGCIMIVKNDIFDDIAEKMVDMGVVIVSKPISRSDFFRQIRIADAIRKRMLGIQSENIKLQKKLEDIRIINRAKCALIQYLSFTEQQAHRYLEKQAMDRRCSKLEVAKGVIKMYET